MLPYLLIHWLELSSALTRWQGGWNCVHRHSEISVEYTPMHIYTKTFKLCGRTKLEINSVRLTRCSRNNKNESFAQILLAILTTWGSVIYFKGYDGLVTVAREHCLLNCSIIKDFSYQVNRWPWVRGTVPFEWLCLYWKKKFKYFLSKKQNKHFFPVFLNFCLFSFTISLVIGPFILEHK